MFLYIDSFFAEPRDREVSPLNEIPDTLNRLYLQAMLEHDREAVYSERTGGRWIKHPDWRLDRSVIRLALFMESRFGLQPGDRVLISAPLGPEWFLTDLAVMASGAVTVAVPAGAGQDAHAGALLDHCPRVAFASAEVLSGIQSMRDSLSSFEHLVSFDAELEEDGVLPFAGVLDLAGTMDTPERAQQFRAVARGTEPGQIATVHYERGPQGLQSEELTQGEIIDRIRSHLTEQPAVKGDTAYIAGPEMTISARLALYAFMGDGYTTAAFGVPGREVADCEELAPDKVILPQAVLSGIVSSGEKAGGEFVRKAFGGRVRWIGCTEPLDTDAVHRFGGISAVAADGAV